MLNMQDFANSLLRDMAAAQVKQPRIVEQVCPYCYGSGLSQVETSGTQYSSCAFCAGRGSITVEEIEVKP